MQAQKALIEAGFAPINPGLTMHEGIAKAFDHETWLEVDLPWVEAADLLIRLPGESEGADREVRAAIEAGVEVLCHDEWFCVENAYVADDPVDYACHLVRRGKLWCQGHESCPHKHRHRWPGAFPETQEAPSVSLPQPCKCVTLEDVTPDWCKEAIVTFAVARDAIRHARDESRGGEENVISKQLQDVWDWLHGIDLGQLKIAKLVEKDCDCSSECTAGPNEACSIELSDASRDLITDALDGLLCSDDGLPIDVYNEIEAFQQWLDPDAPYITLLEGCDTCPPDCDACEAIGSDCGGDETTWITADDVKAKIEAQVVPVQGDDGLSWKCINDFGPTLNSPGAWLTPGVQCMPTDQISPEMAKACDHDDHLAAIRAERGKVYGEPRANHQGIALMWAPMLEPHWQAIKDQKPLPEHVIALLMALLKIDRMRLAYHADNYDDCANYLGFAREWQSDQGGAA